MRKRVLGLIAGIAMALSLGVAAAQPVEYPGASFCRLDTAWPNGPYLGQMHPYHAEHYVRLKKDEACTKWASDHRASAIKGLRALGYTVVAPGSPVRPPRPPTPVVTPEPTPAPTPAASPTAPAVDPGLEHTYAAYLVIMEAIRHLPSDDPGWDGFIDTLTIGPRASSVRITWGALPSGRLGEYRPVSHTIVLAERLWQESLAVQAAILTHEMVHAVAEPAANREECFGWERNAFLAEAAAWRIYGYPGVATPLEQWLTDLVHVVDTPAFAQWVEDAYTHQCAWYVAEESEMAPAA